MGSAQNVIPMTTRKKEMSELQNQVVSSFFGGGDGVSVVTSDVC